MKQSLEESRRALEQERAQHQADLSVLSAQLQAKESCEVEGLRTRLKALESELKETRAERDELRNQLESREHEQLEQLGKLKRLEVIMQ